jgi:hypothetical protein
MPALPLLLLLAACTVPSGAPSPGATPLAELEDAAVALPAAPPVVVPTDPVDAAVPGVGTPRPPLPPAPCPLPVDTAAVATCADGRAATAGGRGYPSVGEAVGAAPAGGVVTVCPGVWDGGLVVDRGVELRAADPTPGATALDGPGGAPLVTTVGPTTLVGLTLSRSWAVRGAAVEAFGDLQLDCVTAEHDTASADGGAVAVEGRVDLRWCTFGDDAAGGSGGAVWATDGVTAVDTVFATSRAALGGAVATSGDLELERVGFVGNLAATGGAASLESWSVASSSLVDVRFERQRAERAGALWARAWAPGALRLERVVFSDNDATTGAGAIELASEHATELVLEDVSFVGNTGGDAGALALSGWLSPGVRLTATAVEFLDGVGGVAGAVWAAGVAGPVRIDASDLRAWRNEGADGAASLRQGDVFRCDACDFGTGADDNVPMDATFGDVATGALPAQF